MTKPSQLKIVNIEGNYFVVGEIKYTQEGNLNITNGLILFKTDRGFNYRKIPYMDNEIIVKNYNYFSVLSNEQLIKLYYDKLDELNKNIQSEVKDINHG